MFNKKIKNLESRIEELEEVLTSPKTKDKEDKEYIGSELDEKLTIEAFEKIVGKEKEEVENVTWRSVWSYFDNWGYGGFSSKKTLFQRVEDLEEKINKIDAIEKFLGIEYKKETKEFKGYKPVSKKKK